MCEKQADIWFYLSILPPIYLKIKKFGKGTDQYGAGVVMTVSWFFFLFTIFWICLFFSFPFLES